MDENKKRVAMVQCEFGDGNGFETSSEIDCTGIQLLLFVEKTLALAAKLLNKDPVTVAKTAILLSSAVTRDEAETGEES